MLQQTTQHKVSTSKNFEAISFSFNASAQAFKIISDNLYSKPVEAIVRELACNAVDAQIKAENKDKKFIVKIPNRMDSTFYIRDFGTGITPQEIREVYTVVFKSDKTHTNNYTGCFGLGSKTPFAVVSQFSVESIVNGKKWIYSAFLDDSRVPAIADISDGGFDTDEPDGVKISFSVPDGKRTDFVEACKKVFPYFKLKPEIKGYDLELKDIEYISFEEGFYGLRVDDYYGKPKAIMGNVCYEIDSSALDKNIPRCIDLYFNVGELTPTPSREHLQYDEPTKAAILKKFERFLKDFVKDSVKKINEAETLMEARKLKSELENHKFIKNDLNHVAPNITWKDKVIVPLKDFTMPYFIRAFASGSEMMSWKGRDLDSGRWLGFTGKFIIPDEKIGFIAKIRFASQSSLRHVLLSSDEKEQREQVKFLKEEIGFADDCFIKSSKLGKPPRAAPGSRTHLARGMFKVFKAIGYKSRASYYWHDIPQNKELDDKVFYVFASRGSWCVTDDGNFNHPDTLTEFVNAFKAIGVDITVVGVVPSAKDKIPPEWKSITESKVFVEWILADKKVETILLADKACDFAITLKILTHKAYDEGCVDQLKDPNLKSFILGAKREKDIRRLAALQTLINYFRLDFSAKFDRVRIEIHELEKKYALLKCIDAYNISKEATKHIYDYLNMIHNQ